MENKTKPFVVVEQLRDYYGRKVFNEVREMVKRNSNVVEYKMENKEVWEWVGPMVNNK